MLTWGQLAQMFLQEKKNSLSRWGNSPCPLPRPSPLSSLLPEKTMPFIPHAATHQLRSPALL